MDLRGRPWLRDTRGNWFRVAPTDRLTARPTGPDRMGGGQTGPDGGRAGLERHPRSRLPIKDHGPCFATNEHPRRDTDVILRQSKALLELFNSR